MRTGCRSPATRRAISLCCASACASPGTITATSMPTTACGKWPRRPRMTDWPAWRWCPVLEARGLDVPPGMIVKLRGLGDEATAALLEVIPRAEVAHVAAGSRWFRWYCERAGVAPGPKFRELLAEYARAVLHGPFNVEARAAAGFGEDELAALRQLSG